MVKKGSDFTAADRDGATVGHAGALLHGWHHPPHPLRSSPEWVYFYEDGLRIILLFKYEGIFLCEYISIWVYFYVDGLRII